MKDYPRVLTVQDISCLGQCSTAVALPILSACGCEACVLPTMMLSTHTGGLGKPFRLDLTEYMEKIVAHWKSQNITFDAILVGYLGKPEQVQLVLDLIQDLLAPEGKLLVDPAMADHGKLYSGICEGYEAKMSRLCAAADVILPNVTEACLLTQRPYRENPEEAFLRELAQQLHSLSGKQVVITGVALQEGMTGAAIFDGKELIFVSHPVVPGSYHGTGDMFAAALTGLWSRGKSLVEAARAAAAFTHRVIANTHQAPAHTYGTKFETALHMLRK